MNYHDIIKGPVISEKSMANANAAKAGDETAKKRYTFKVDPNANKVEIKQAIEKIFSVQVSKVNTMNYEGKLKKQGRTMGRRPSFKKAVITLTKNSKGIELFEGI